MSTKETNFRGEYYKKRGLCFGNNDGKRILRSERMCEDRKDRRRNDFQTRRHIEEEEPVPGESATKETNVLKEVPRNYYRLEALSQWKKEKENKIRLLKKIEKPIFKVSVVKHKLYSPPVCYCNKENCRSTACVERKLKAKKEDKLMGCATPKLSWTQKQAQLSSSRKKVVPLVNSDGVKQVQPQHETVEKPAVEVPPASPVPFAVNQINKENLVSGTPYKVTVFATPKPSKKPNHLSSSLKKVLSKVDSGRKRRIHPQGGDVEGPVIAAPTSPVMTGGPQDQNPVVDVEENTVGSSSSSAQTSLVSGEWKRKSQGLDEDRGESVPSEITNVPPLELTALKETENTGVAVLQESGSGNVCVAAEHVEVVEEHRELETQKPVDSDLDNVDFPAMHSPYITVTRGKNKRNSQKKDLFSPGVFSSTPTRHLQNLSNVLSELDKEEGVHGVKYFKFKLKTELVMLQCLCDYWSAVQKLDGGSLQDFQDLIDSAVGLCKLLMTKKMAQFEILIANCENHTGEKPVTVDDLQGFWDVMYIQVIDVRKRFYTLEGLYINGKQKPDTISTKKNKNKTSRTKKVSDNGKPKVEAKSSMRAMIAAARKKQKEESVAKSNVHEDMLSDSVAEKAQTTPLRYPLRRSASFHQQVLIRESQRKTVTWDNATPDHSVSTIKEQSLSLSIATATPKSALKKKSQNAELESSKAEVTFSSPKTEYSLTPYVRRSRRSRYSTTPKNSQTTGDLSSFETPVEEPARVRRSKRLGSTGLK